eukprot:6964981-Ditylum_brightwellii.AAC.1
MVAHCSTILLEVNFEYLELKSTHILETAKDYEQFCPLGVGEEELEEKGDAVVTFSPARGEDLEEETFLGETGSSPSSL